MNIEPAKGADRAELLDFLYAVFTRGNPKHARFETFCDDLFEPTDEAMGRHLVVREGGRIVSCGTPEEVAADPASVTGKYLTEIL